ncbi:MAG: cation:proton antiporter [Crenarchaeota archaeon]|nr:cation:proton antiporter [Thermoproteota archaeon]
MNYEIQVITDLAVLMVIASVIGLLFSKLKQPIIVAYLIAGIIIGPFTPPFSLVQNLNALNLFAEIGVILILFTIGLEFPLNKLKTLGRVAIGVSIFEISSMLCISWILGTFLLNWSFNDTMFLGAALTSSSTTIIAKVLSDMGKIREVSSTIMLSMLVIEDIVVVIILAALQKLTIAHTISFDTISTLLLKLAFLAIITLIVGFCFLTKIIDQVARTGNREVLYILILGLCFGFSILSNQLGFSVAIGAFLIGLIFAKTHCRELISREIEPFKFMFGAIFFVSIGALMDITQITNYWIPALIITVAVILTKFSSCTFGTYLLGYDKKTALKIGLGMAQIGEFAFIVAKVGQDVGVISDFLLPILAVATIITAFLTPYLIKLSYKEPKTDQL